MSKLKTLHSKTIYANRFLTVVEDTTDQGVYSLVKRADSVIVVPLSPTGMTLLVNVYRYPIKEYSWEFPSGSVDADESLTDGATRELFEETGLKATKLTKVGTFHPVPALSTQKATVFIAHITDVELQKATHEHSGGEVVEIKSLPLTEVKTMAKNGEIIDGFMLSALGYV